jgi:hypothetical protein
MLRPPKRGSIHAHLQIHLDFTVALDHLMLTIALALVQ